MLKTKQSFQENRFREGSAARSLSSLVWFSLEACGSSFILYTGILSPSDSLLSGVFRFVFGLFELVKKKMPKTIKFDGGGSQVTEVFLLSDSVFMHKCVEIVVTV